MDTETTTDVWEFLERPNTHARQAQACYQWGLNCDRSGNPFLVFLDLIGWSEENYGQHLILGQSKHEGRREQHLSDVMSLGYTELSYLADALNEYALFPNEVTEWLNALMMCEGV